jgi:hypothetical protein
MGWSPFGWSYIVGLTWIWFRAHFLPINRPAPLERPCSCHISEFSNRLYMLTIHASCMVACNLLFFYIYIPHFPWVGKVFFFIFKDFSWSLTVITASMLGILGIWVLVNRAMCYHLFPIHFCISLEIQVKFELYREFYGILCFDFFA